jgi:hypothetical protein
MSASRPRNRNAVITGVLADLLERRTLFDAAIRTVSLVDDVNYTTTPATDVAVDPYGDVYATRTGGDGTAATQLVVVQPGYTTPQVLSSFGPMQEYADTEETPTGQMIVDGAGDVFGVTQFQSTGEIPLGEDYTQGTLWELPARFGVVDVLARFYRPETAPRSLTIDKAGNLYGVVDSLLGQGSSVFEYPADETGVVTVSLGVGTYAAAVVSDPAGDIFGTLASSGDPAGAFSLFEVKHGGTSPTILATVPATLGTDVAGLIRDAAGDLFITTRQGPNGGTLLELPTGGNAVHLMAGGSGPAFNGKPIVDDAGDVFATADTAGGGSVVLKLPAGGAGLQTVATFATGDVNGVSLDALGNVFGTYADSSTGQATIFEVSGTVATPTPTATTPTPTTTATGLVPMVTRSALPTTVVGGTKGVRQVTVTLTNTTAAAEVGTATVTVYATPTGSAATSGVRLAAVAHAVRLPAGGGTTLSLNVRPTALAAGVYTLLAVATDTTGNVIASSAGPTLNVVAASISLSANVTSVPAVASVGGWVTLTLALTNAGTVDSVGPVTATFGLLGGDGTEVTLGTVRRGVTVKANGKPSMLKLRVRLPVTAAAETYLPTVDVVQRSQTASAVGVTTIGVIAA